jgi:hypothetical protein
LTLFPLMIARPMRRVNDFPRDRSDGVGVMVSMDRVRMLAGLLLVGSGLSSAAAFDWTHWAGDAAHSATAPAAPASLDHVAWIATPQPPPGELEEFVHRSSVVATDAPGCSSRRPTR